MDIHARLREDHRAILASLEALRAEYDPARARQALADVRRAWIVHALAEESVVYRALESSAEPLPQSAERFVEHEVVGQLFDRLGQARPGTLEWRARLNVARGMIARHLEEEERELRSALEGRFDASGLHVLAQRFASARDKLAMLEEAKAA